MGGLKNDLPITYWTFLIGALAIAGVPGLAGFFSKDEILFRTFASGHTLLWAIGLLTSLLTAIYMFRLVFLAFHGADAGTPRTAPGARPPEHGARTHRHGTRHSHLHDAPPAMAFALDRARDRVGRWPATSACRTRSADAFEQFLEPSFRGGRDGAGGAKPARRQPTRVSS